MKLMEATTVKIDGRNFAIYPFGAFYAANLSGELARFIGPFVAGGAPLLKMMASDNKDADDLDINEVMPGVYKALEGLDGNKVEELLRKLLIIKGNVAVTVTNDFGVAEMKTLNGDIADEIFAQDIQNMYILAFHVIQVNFKGFFRKLLAQSGLQGVAEKILSSNNTDNSTLLDSNA